MTATIRATLPEGWANKYSLLNALEADTIILTLESGEKIAPSQVPHGQRVMIFDSIGASILVVRNATAARGRRGMWHITAPITKRTI